MKKIVTLLIAVGSFVAVHAQKSKDEARGIILGGGSNSGGTSSRQGRDVILGGGNDNTGNYPTYPNSYPGTNGSRQSQVDQVNREYDSKIYSIRNNGTLTQSEKERMIRQLEKDRAQRIKEINNYSNRNYSNRNYSKGGKNCDDRNESKSNNGKHKGWSQGKGNQKKHKGYDD
jgi:hypothetical protein